MLAFLYLNFLDSITGNTILISRLTMNYLKAKCKKTAALLGLLILMYVIIRLLFVFMVSTDAAQYITFTKYIWYCWKGLRFDIAGLCILNILFLLVYFFPMKFVEANWMKNILRYLLLLFQR